MDPNDRKATPRPWIFNAGRIMGGIDKNRIGGTVVAENVREGNGLLLVQAVNAFEARGTKVGLYDEPDQPSGMICSECSKPMSAGEVVCHACVTERPFLLKLEEAARGCLGLLASRVRRDQKEGITDYTILQAAGGLESALSSLDSARTKSSTGEAPATPRGSS